MYQLLFFLIFIMIPLGTCAAASPVKSVTPLELLVDEALASNPDIKAARERWQMFTHKVLPARSLDDPRLSFSISNYPVDSFATDERNMTGNDLKIEQSLPFPGKLDAKGEVARQQALWYEGAYEDARLQLVMKVKDTWYRIYYHDRALAITRKNIGLLEDFILLTKTRYEVGEALQQDVLKAQVERSKLMDRLFALQQERESLLAEFNRLLARPGATPLKIPEEIHAHEVSPELTQIQKKALSQRPLFASYKSLIDQYRAEKDLAKLDYYPDFNVFASYRVRDDNLPDDGTDFFSAGVSVNIPLWHNKQAAQVAQATSGMYMAQRQYDNFRNQIFAGIQDTMTRLEKNRTRIEFFESGILPQARQSFEASLAAYQVGKVDFLNLLDSLLNLYRYEIDYHRAFSSYLRSIARLEAISGVSLVDKLSG